MPICKSITKIDNLDESTDVLRVEISPDIEALMMFNSNEALQYVGKEVIVTYRKDMWKGEIVPFINTITIPVMVNSLVREDNVRFFVNEQDNYATVNFLDIDKRTTIPGARVYCVSQEFDSGAKTFVKLRIRDKLGRTAIARLFDYDTDNVDFAGRYIKCDLKKNQYGFVTTYVAPTNETLPSNPELDIAEKYILATCSDKPELLKMMDATSYISKIRNYVSIERGYEIVRLALELSMCGELPNMTDTVDLRALEWAFLMDKTYTQYGQDRAYSENFLNTNGVAAASMASSRKKKVINIIDTNGVPSAEKEIYNSIRHMVQAVIASRKEVI